MQSLPQSRSWRVAEHVLAEALAAIRGAGSQLSALSVQALFWHDWVVMSQTVPQAPQLLLSVVVSTQVVAPVLSVHWVRPESQFAWHTPPEQTSPFAVSQSVPQPPQLFGRWRGRRSRRSRRSALGSAQPQFVPSVQVRPWAVQSLSQVPQVASSVDEAQVPLQ